MDDRCLISNALGVEVYFGGSVIPHQSDTEENTHVPLWQRRCHPKGTDLLHVTSSELTRVGCGLQCPCPKSLEGRSATEIFRDLGANSTRIASKTTRGEPKSGGHYSVSVATGNACARPQGPIGGAW
jgi:hypothetical protein